MPVKVEYRNKCDKCEKVWYSNEYKDKCSKCRIEEKTEENKNKQSKNNNTYKGYKDKYTGYYGKDWQEKKEKALQRDNYKCKICGVTQKEHIEKDEFFGKNLHVHHIIPAKKFDSYKKANTIGNLVTLCSKCHSKAPN